MNNVWVKPLIGIALMLLTSSTHALEKNVASTRLCQ